MPRAARNLDLSKIWLFSTCTGKELRVIGHALEEVAAPAGRVLCEEGTIGREFFFVADGRASVRRGGRKVALLGPGDYFGELALLEDAPPLARKLLAAMAERLRDADTKVSALISH